MEKEGFWPVSDLPGDHFATFFNWEMSPPLNSPVPGDPGFADRAARHSCFGARGKLGLPEAVKLARVPSSRSLNAGGILGPSTPMAAEFRPAQEASSASGESNLRKRKAVPKCKGKEAFFPSSPPKYTSKMCEEADGNAKKCKAGETNGDDKVGDAKPKEEGGDVGKQEKESAAKPPEPPKDYIHVRARRGQATDSHSLAERVRREKISERMKFLQDLVPGCNKVTGKAVMLDEIINYVQSLQRQVEFLSMKLATMNPRLDFTMENFQPKDMLQIRGPMLPAPVYPLETAATTAAFSYPYQAQPDTTLHISVTTSPLEAQFSVNHLESNLCRNVNFDSATQIENFWEDDLHTIVQMGFGQNQDAALVPQCFQGSLSATHMKIEL